MEERCLDTKPEAGWAETTLNKTALGSRLELQLLPLNLREGKDGVLGWVFRTAQKSAGGGRGRESAGREAGKLLWFLVNF